MYLTRTLASFFSKAVRDRGRRYYQNDLVAIRQAGDRSLTARVRGSEAYAVKLQVNGKDLLVSCTCPYFIENFCKHLWATLLAAEAQGHLFEVARSVRFLKMDDGSLDDPDDPRADGEELAIARKRETIARILEQFQTRQAPTRTPPAPAEATWKRQLEEVKSSMTRRQNLGANKWPGERQVYYFIDLPASQNQQGLILELYCREKGLNGEWKKPKALKASEDLLERLPDPADQQILSLLVGASGDLYGAYFGATHSRFCIRHPLEQMLMPLICRTGRCRLKYSPQLLGERAIAWDDGEAWQFWVQIRPHEYREAYVVEGSLRRDGEQQALSKPVLLLKGGLVFWDTLAARLDDNGAFSWVNLLRREGALAVPADEKNELLEKILALPKLPRLDLPEEIDFEEKFLTPQPVINIRQHEQRYYRGTKLQATICFNYDGRLIPQSETSRGFFQVQDRAFILRDKAFEAAAGERLNQLGLRPINSYQPTADLEFAANRLAKIARILLAENWQVEAEGKLYRHPGNLAISVSSGIDWFELNGNVEFGDTTASFPALLAALRRGENTVRLDDGTFGVLPEEWLQKYRLLAAMGDDQDTHLRFKRSQAGLLDALLASQAEATFDAGFQKARDELRNFSGIKAVDPPASFTGTLREYQREGLGWLHFLRQFGFGGCLADDMGLGKTPQTLALLEARRQQRVLRSCPPTAGKNRKTGKNAGSAKTGDDASSTSQTAGAGGSASPPGPSLVVVPKSLVFNWKQEAARFTPELRLLDHTGGLRRKSTAHFGDYDVILTTYGTLRKDALHFKDYQFDYLILDESQAIKNAATESAKAARLLRGDYKLALSGTPIENHPGELWSLFEFLNPGLLGSTPIFKLSGASGAQALDEEARSLLAKGLRPFILRRTKAQVAKELPEKLEQTIYCELDKTQRKLYNELREHYRNTLLGLVEAQGIGKSKIKVLEALLRLRQAACHPGLLDKKRLTETSAKLELLLPRLQELHEEGHKVLVFSQFTSFLSILKSRLVAEKISYEYLDGKTRDRAARVERFQNDRHCRLFLISLKAGGLGLNLTEAEYVFLLDPWWNPAVEAQAIDRAHRIGQRRRVFAYRLIARDTVEEKVLELQNSKRQLADAIINADNSLIRGLGREDLELLLS
jgi:hypothetical protein